MHTYKTQQPYTHNYGHISRTKTVMMEAVSGSEIVICLNYLPRLSARKDFIDLDMMYRMQCQGSTGRGHQVHWRLNLLRGRLILVGTHFGTCHLSIA